MTTRTPQAPCPGCGRTFQNRSPRREQLGGFCGKCASRKGDDPFLSAPAHLPRGARWRLDRKAMVRAAVDRLRAGLEGSQATNRCLQERCPGAQDLLSLDTRVRRAIQAHAQPAKAEREWGEVLDWTSAEPSRELASVLWLGGNWASHPQPMDSLDLEQTLRRRLQETRHAGETREDYLARGGQVRLCPPGRAIGFL